MDWITDTDRTQKKPYSDKMSHTRTVAGGRSGTRSSQRKHHLGRTRHQTTHQVRHPIGHAHGDGLEAKDGESGVDQAPTEVFP